MMIFSVALLLTGSCISVAPVHAQSLPADASGPTVGLLNMLIDNSTEPVEAETNTTLPPTTTDENSFCAGFMPGDTPGTYMRLTGGRYYHFSCLPPLIWSQETCSCESRRVKIEDPNCPHHRPFADDSKMYQRRVYGVWLAAPFRCPVNQIWFQERCWCDVDRSAPVPPQIEEPPEIIDPVTRKTTEPTTTRREGSTVFIVHKGVVEEEVTVETNDNSTTPSYCEGFRPGPEPNTYQQKSGRMFYNFTCQDPLVWSQQECSCQGREVTIEDPNCPHHRAYPGDNTGSQYQVRDHGVWKKNPVRCPVNQIWNQTNCWCDYGKAKEAAPDAQPVVQEQITGPCFPIFNATFDEDIKDDSSFEFGVGREPWQAISLGPYMDGSYGGTARVNFGRMPLWFTGGNNFGGKLQIEIRFMVIEGKKPPNEDIVVLSNERCSAGPQTISIAFRPSDERYTVFFRDMERAEYTSCYSPSSKPYGFHHVNLIFFNELLTLTVDGVQCFGNAKYQTGMMPTGCFIGIGSNNFDGYIDEVVFRRGCLEE